MGTKTLFYVCAVWQVAISLVSSVKPGVSTMTTTTLSLGNDRHWRPSARAVRLHCLQGSIWVTSAGEDKDIVLTPGMSLALDGRRHVLVGAVGASVFQVVESEVAPARWRQLAFRLWARGLTV